MLNQGYFLNGYEIRSIVGRGGFGVVYEGVHRELGIEVAIKEYFPAELCVRHGQTIQPSKPEFQASFEESLDRFIKEAKQLEKFRYCPNIVNCRDLFRANGTAYIVMDYVHGLPLSVLLERREANGKPFTEKDLLQVTLPLLRGLQTVHEAGVCHRDIKPSNILIRRTDHAPILIDFGAAKHEISRHTKSFAPYSDGYAAWEQVGEGQIGPWTDIYGIGAVMWRMVAGGTPPFSPPNPVVVQKRVFELMHGRRDPLPSAEKIGNKRFSERILQTIDDSLAINVNERVQNASDLIKGLMSQDAEADWSSIQKPKERSPENATSNQTTPKLTVERERTNAKVGLSESREDQSDQTGRIVEVYEDDLLEDFVQLVIPLTLLGAAIGVAVAFVYLGGEYVWESVIGTAAIGFIFGIWVMVDTRRSLKSKK